jgi:hypothetical protein
MIYNYIYKIFKKLLLYIYAPGFDFPVFVRCQKLGPKSGSSIFFFFFQLEPEPAPRFQVSDFPVPVLVSWFFFFYTPKLYKQNVHIKHLKLNKFIYI